MEKKFYPQIKTQLPGPKARRLIEEDHQFVSPSYTRSYPLVAEKGEGFIVEDVDGNRFLDFTAGIATCATGHCHPKVVEAITRQAQKLIHMSGTDFYYQPQIKLAKKLAQLFPGQGPAKVYFGNSGTEGIEAAMKLARYHTRRQYFISFLGGFHGRTYGALSLTGSKVVQRERFGPLIPGVVHAPYGYCYRCPYNSSPESCMIDSAEWIEDVLFRTILPAEEVAGIVVETIQGEGGYVVPPLQFHQNLSRLAQKYGILYIVDEVQSGMGRTGKMFAIEHYGVRPDIVVTAKGIASGLPLGVMIASASLMDWGPGSHASTFGGNPVACEAALTTIELLENGLMQNAADVGAYLLDKLKKLQTQHPLIGDVRGMGLMIGIELVQNLETKTPAIQQRNKLINKCFEKGLLILGCGLSVIRLAPPLIISRHEADVALAILEESLIEVEKATENREP
jgi:4-aminobutyrate aminotransferase